MCFTPDLDLNEFDGSPAAFADWQWKMSAFLQTQGLWRVVDGSRTRPATVNPLTEANEEAQAKWDELDEMAQGHLCLRLANHLYHYVGTTSADTWTNLITAFGTPKPTDILAVINFRISGGRNSASEIYQLLAQIKRLRLLEWHSQTTSKRSCCCTRYPRSGIVSLQPSCGNTRRLMLALPLCKKP